jgi:hypothetical protein
MLTPQTRQRATVSLCISVCDLLDKVCFASTLSFGLARFYERQISFVLPTPGVVYPDCTRLTATVQAALFCNVQPLRFNRQTIAQMRLEFEGTQLV